MRVGIGVKSHFVRSKALHSQSRRNPIAILGEEVYVRTMRKPRPVSYSFMTISQRPVVGVRDDKSFVRGLLFDSSPAAPYARCGG